MTEPKLTDEEVKAALAEALERKRGVLEQEEKKRRRDALETELRRPWNAAETLAYCLDRFAHIYKKPFAIDQYNAHGVDALALYYANDPLFETMGDRYSLEKGILVRGLPGRGKSWLMKLFARNKRQCYNMVSTRHIAEAYAIHGSHVFQQYRGPIFPPSNDSSVFYQKQVGYTFDDLGTEEAKANFGNKVNVMNNILLDRYDKGDVYPFPQTNITTNLDFKEIEDSYGTRLRSRMAEQYNVIDLTGPDRRKM